MAVNKYDKLMEKKYKNPNLQLKITPQIMGLFCEYALSDNASIHRAGLVNLRSLLTGIDPNLSFENNPNLIQRYNLCLDILTAKLDKNLTQKEYVITDVKGITGDKYKDLNIDAIGEISTSNVMWVESEVIPNYLNARLINNSIIELQRECTKYATADPGDIPTYLNNIYQKVEDIYVQKRRNEIDSDEADSLFQLSKSENTVSAIWNRQRSTGYKLITGMQALNTILGGGFEERRVYCIFGLPGDGKTITLLNLMYQIKKYNPSVQTKDPTKKPAIVLLTMENFIHEEVQTLYNIAVCNENISDRPLDEVLKAIQDSDLFKNKDGTPNPIELFIKFKPINSVTTDYMYKLTEDLNDEGYEVICILQDYIMRIKSSDTPNSAEERVKLGNIINEFKNYSMHYGIPVITAAQLNREAARTIDAFRGIGKFDDMINKVGRANIAESSQLDFNLDGIIFIAPCYEGQSKWQAFKLIKHRYKLDLLPSQQVFFQPFTPGMPAKLMEDVGRIESEARASINYDPELSETKALFDNAIDMGEKVAPKKKKKEENTYALNAELDRPKLVSSGVKIGLKAKSDIQEIEGKAEIFSIIPEEEMDDFVYNQYIQEILFEHPDLIKYFPYIENG